MAKTRNLLAFFALVASFTGCDQRTPSYSHSGGVVDGWKVWGHSATGQRYSANTQITPDNVKDLKVAWMYRTGDMSGVGPTGRGEFKQLAFEATPNQTNNTQKQNSPRN